MIQILCTNGYMATFMPHHPMAASNGYIYVHRIVMATKLGRMLTSDEEVHHKNEMKTDNRVSNLEVLTSSEHRKLHRKSGKRLRDPGEPNPLVFCQCGCEERFPMFDDQGRYRRFISGHNKNTANTAGVKNPKKGARRG
jgi:hypothetical protein